MVELENDTVDDMSVEEDDGEKQAAGVWRRFARLSVDCDLHSLCSSAPPIISSSSSRSQVPSSCDILSGISGM